MTGSPAQYLEAAVQSVLTAADPAVDATVGHAALLVASAGAAADADHLVRRWLAATERPVSALVPDAVTARAWAMLSAARPGGAPGWAAELPPLDLDAEESAHHRHLGRAEPPLPPGLLGDSLPAQVVTGLAEHTERPRRDPLRALAAEAESAARDGDEEAASAALHRWAELAWRRPRPDVATLAACRHVAPLLVAGALPAPRGWPRDCADALIAALHTRYRPAPAQRDWPGLLAEVLRLRGEEGPLPAPATPGALADAEHRLGRPLPADYREFLLTCDGFPADVVFPRLLGAADLVPTGPRVRISEPEGVELDPATGRVFEHDPLFGTTVHSGIRALVEEHLRLLEAAGPPSGRE
ncbi:hypothetical protein B0I33_104310 [Prauserella shujinwangii]|uniref:Knr4/Smi1-like domain-containing protein n=1 Tax=Prauserella shujinwangii TaxID=1453103 RepID=A0A2T0LWU6_9PSEU|nr:SMI1/KNR4 family protein [Prauserella shujinwangii]PRX48493.1 hypothetical protein B0I33_104310 [Prauserella shujinwangii]